MAQKTSRGISFRLESVGLGDGLLQSFWRPSNGKRALSTIPIDSRLPPFGSDPTFFTTNPYSTSFIGSPHASKRKSASKNDRSRVSIPQKPIQKGIRNPVESVEMGLSYPDDVSSPAENSASANDIPARLRLSRFETGFSQGSCLTRLNPGFRILPSGFSIHSFQRSVIHSLPRALNQALYIPLRSRYYDLSFL